MTKSDIISILRIHKGYISFPGGLKVSGPKKLITGIDLHGEQVRVYSESGVTDWDYAESEVHEVIISKLSHD